MKQVEALPLPAQGHEDIRVPDLGREQLFFYFYAAVHHRNLKFSKSEKKEHYNLFLFHFNLFPRHRTASLLK